MPSQLTAPEVYERLERRILGPEGQGHRAFLFPEVDIRNEDPEVDSTVRRADAISMDLWHSRGHLIQGFEIKVSREDWLNELHHPEKADPIVRMCDHFWLVTNPEVLRPNELPEKWGLLLTAGRRRHLVVEKEAPLLDHTPPDHAMVVSMLRRIQAQGEDRIEEVRQDAERRGEERAGYQRERAEETITEDRKQLDEWRESWDAFRAAAGFEWGLYSPKPGDLELIGEIVRALKDGPKALENLANRVRQVEEGANQLGGQLNDALATVHNRIFGKGQAA